jgi:hypothetical protein
MPFHAEAVHLTADLLAAARNVKLSRASIGLMRPHDAVAAAPYARSVQLCAATERGWGPNELLLVQQNGWVELYMTQTPAC